MMFLRSTRPLLLASTMLGALLAVAGCTRESEQMDPLGSSPDALSESQAHPLVGQFAPPLATERLSGEQVDLAQHQGDVVLLDFWASWCPPCVEGLPKVAEVASQLKDEGVVFYAVNVGEDAETVEAFLSEQGLDLPVLMDPEGTIAEAYGADAIPQTVLIGAEGTVQAVHVGLSSDIESKLRGQLQALLDGEDL